MIVFATPDFGASGSIVCCLFFVWVLIFAAVLVGLYWGARLRVSQSAKVRVCGIVLMIASSGLPPFCWLAPPHVVRILYGNYPLGSYPNGKIQNGMTKDQVTAILGNPHERYARDDEESWYYWLDSLDINYFCVRFGADGKVTGTHGN